MSRFDELRTLLETNLEQLAQATGDPQRFRQEFANLQGYWQSGDTEEALVEQTLDVMRRYPPAWAALEHAGLVEPAAPPAASVPASSPPPAGRIEGGSPPKPHKGETIMAKQKKPLTERLAIWDKTMAIIKEGIAGLLGLMIVGATVAVAVAAIWWVADAEASARVKDILLLLTGLTGVVLGYYFGRIPGEARADKAQGEANAARSDLDRTVAEVGAILDEAGAARERGMPAEEDGLTPTQAARLRAIVRRHE